MSSSQVQIVNPPNNPPLVPEYSMISIAPLSSSAQLVSIAGQVGFDSASGKMRSSMKEQVQIALKNIDLCLARAGLTKKDIIYTRQYVAKMSQLGDEDKAARGEAVMEWLDGAPAPPSVLAGVESLRSYARLALRNRGHGRQKLRLSTASREDSTKPEF